jgi:hypothetical protein
VVDARRRKGGGGGGGMGHIPSPPVVMLTPGSVPSDEQLEQEALALESEIQGKYDIAKKDDLNLATLQRMSGEEIAKLAKKEGLEDVSIPKQRLVFEILKQRAKKHGLMVAEGTLEVHARWIRIPAQSRVLVSPLRR